MAWLSVGVTRMKGGAVRNNTAAHCSSRRGTAAAPGTLHGVGRRQPGSLSDHAKPDAGPIYGALRGREDALTVLRPAPHQIKRPLNCNVLGEFPELWQFKKPAALMLFGLPG